MNFDQEQLEESFVSQLQERALFFTDPEGRIRTWNPGVENLLGYSRDEFVNQHLEILSTPEDRQKRVAEREVREANEKGRASDVRWHAKKDGSRIYADGLTIALRNEAGEVIALGKIMRDATFQRRFEQQLQSLAHALEQAQTMVRSPDGTIRFWSSGCERLYGYSRGEALGRNVFELLQTDFPAALADLERELRERELWHGQLRHRHKEGWLLVTETDWILDRQGPDGPELVIDASAGINELMRAADERERLMLTIQRSNEELSQFSNIVSHDLQAPLRTIRTFAEMLSQQPAVRLDEKAAEFTLVVMNAAKGMSELIQGLLQYAQAGEEEAPVEKIPVKSIVEAVLSVLQHAIRENDARVTYSDLPTVEGFRVPLQQVFQNLIGNTLKYRSPERPLRIHISARQHDAISVFSIEDNGIGISVSDRDRIFRPMTRLHGNDIPGAGIGLAVCRKIVERHNGRIWVESELGMGSTFYFSLPARGLSAAR